MASLEELKAAVRDALDSRGVLDELRAAVRSEVFRTLDEGDVAKPKPDGDTWLINELIREYLAYHGLRHTLAVFHPEAGQPSDPIERPFIAQQVGLADDETSHRIPLLYGLLSSQRQRAGVSGR